MDVRAANAESIGGRYRLVERLASGGMGEVWRAHDEQIERDVAVKLLRDDLARDPAAVRRFRREARLAASLEHPNVASIYDVVNGDRPAIVMELVEGETLAAAMARGPMSVVEATGIGDGVLAALEAAHAAGIVHRDVTPGNVLLSKDGRVKVADFGIARADEETGRLTDTGMVMGTAHYLAPEQLRDEPPTAATDQYAVGLLLYEALAGTRPFTGPTPAAAALARLQAPPPPLADRRPDVPPPLAALIMRALEEDPLRRFESISAMLSNLHRVPTATGGAGADQETMTVANVPVAAGTTTPLPAAPPAPPSRRRRAAARPPRRPVVVAVVAALLALVVAMAVANANDGPGVGEVPDLVGLAIGEAQDVAADAGFRLDPQEVENAAAEGTVVAQSLPAATRAERRGTITVDVSTGPPPCCTVPAVVDMLRADAEAQIQGAGLTVGEVNEEDSERPAGTVLAQAPAPSTHLEPDTEVDLTVSKGPEEDGDDERRGKGRGNDDD